MVINFDGICTHYFTIEYAVLPGQRTQAHDAVSISFPSHSFPPLLGSGSVHVLVCVFVELAPQVSVQSVQSDQADQPPSTVDSRPFTMANRSINNNALEIIKIIV